MNRRLWKNVLLILAAGTTLALGFGGCLDTTIERILVGLAA
jgi:hypothetical protein